MKRRARAAWRLSRIALHVLHGVAIALWSFRSLDETRRRAKVAWWAGKMLRVAGVAHASAGTPAAGGSLMVANHVSWLDIVAIHAVCPQARFVSKADVRHWPVLNRLVDAAGTLYLERERRRDAMRVLHHVGDALQAGDTVAVFPEGTTGDGRELLPFHANLLQAALSTGTPVQPVALRYADAADAISEAVVYVGDTTLLESLWRVACAEGLRVRVAFLPPSTTPETERRALAARLRSTIDAALADPIEATTTHHWR